MEGPGSKAQGSTRRSPQLLCARRILPGGGARTLEDLLPFERRHGQPLRLRVHTLCCMDLACAPLTHVASRGRHLRHRARVLPRATSGERLRILPRPRLATCGPPGGADAGGEPPSEAAALASRRRSRRAGRGSTTTSEADRSRRCTCGATAAPHARTRGGRRGGCAAFPRWRAGHGRRGRAGGRGVRAGRGRGRGRGRRLGVRIPVGLPTRLTIASI